MNDFNLIPDDYLRMLAWRADMVRTCIALLAVVAIAVSLAGALQIAIAKKEKSIDVLQSKRQISQRQRNEITSLSGERDKLQAYLDFLVGLRGGAVAPDMFVCVDRALPGNEIWFQSWEFQRAGFAVGAEEAKHSNGYFIIAPAKSDGAAAEAWKIETHMNVRGQATDHAALSRFVAKLHRQGEVNDVRILHTALNPSMNVVDFNLVITVDNSDGGSVERST